MEYHYLMIMLLSHWYDFSDVGTEKLVKKLELHAILWFSIGISDPKSYDSIQIS
ncbi:MAG: hypothetical protein ACMUEL_07075 [Flavobacteriales bacterium Tduv]